MKYTEEQLDAYIKGEMQPQEKAEFENQMKEDAELAAEVNMLRAMVSGLKSRQDKVDRITTWQAETKYKSSAKGRGWVPWISAFSAAAVVVLGVFLFQFQPVQKSPVPTGSIDTDRARGVSFPEIDRMLEKHMYDDARDAIANETKDIENRLEEALMRKNAAEKMINEGQRRKAQAEEEIRQYEYMLKMLKDKAYSLP